MKRLQIILLCTLVALSCAETLIAQSIGYVDISKTDDAGNGSSWGTAYKTLTNALLKIAGSSTTTLYVAQGTYSDFTNSTGLVVSNHTLQGGYPTGGGARDWVAYPTIIDGTNGVSAFKTRGIGPFTLDGFTIRNCTNSANGGAITVSAGALNVYNCTFTTNCAATSGGAIYHNAAAINTFSNCTFIANSAAGGSGCGGGAIYFAAASTNTIQSCAFVTNTATSRSGGAIYTGASLDQYTGCGFTNNTAAFLGGAILISGGSRHVFSNCTFTTNSQASGSGWGGAICLNAGSVTNVFQSCLFVANVSAYRGGAFGDYQGTCSGSSDQFTGCVFSNNVATDNGGAIGSDALTLDLSEGGNVFYANSSGSSGGAIWTRNTPSAIIRNCAFVKNTAGNGGALCNGANGACTSVVMNCTFFTNSGTGGAINLAHASDVLNVTNCIFWGNTSGSTGTNIQNSGTLNLAYCDINTNAGWITGGTKNFGAGITNVDPLFASVVAPYDVHLQSQYGRYSGGSWVTDGATSPCIDAGDPTMSPVLEPQPNGGRINMGAYGNTVQASKSAFAAMFTENVLATNVTTSAATLCGRILVTNEVTATAYIYYGETDAFSNKASWGFLATNGLVTGVAGFTTTVAVAADKLYYWRCYVSNGTSAAWAQTSNMFMTASVTVKATDASASEVGPDPGEFTLYRAAQLTGIPTTVYYSLSGTASNGVDYQPLSGSVVIPAGSTSTVVTVTPLADANWTEGNETVTLTVHSGYDYPVGADSSAVVTIANDNTNGGAYLDISRPDDTGNGNSWATAFQSLSNAITKMPGLSATNLWVAKGTYIVANVDILTNSIFGGFPTSGGAWPTRDWTNNVTIFDANLTNRVLRRSVAGNSFIDGLYIVNGSVAGAGGGFYSSANSPVAFYNCTFTNNTITGNRGGAIYMQATSLSVTNVFSNCTFIGNATLTANFEGGAISIFTGANLNYFYSCNFIANRSAAAGGAFNTAGGAGSGIFIYNCLFSNNISVVGNGGAIGSGDSALIITNSIFTGNTSSNGNAGAISHSFTGATNIFSNVVFQANSSAGASKSGGAIYFSANTTSTFFNCSFVTNSCIGSASIGGAVRDAGGLVRLTGCAFSNNWAGSYGGAISSASMLDLSGGSNVFYGNISSNSGGAIYHDAAVTNNVFSNCAFVANQCGLNFGGGAINFQSISTNTFNNCSFITNTQNRASGARGGGAINVETAGANLLNIVNCTFFANYGRNGGAIRTPASGIMNVTNSIFWANTSGGGANATNIYNGGTLNLAYCDIGTNSTEVSGGTKNFGDGIISADPLFVSESEPYDVHEKSLYGHYSNGTWVIDSAMSMCIDAGVPYDAVIPESVYTNEPDGNGMRINMGCYGNTIEASRSSLPLSKSGTVIVIF